MNPYEMVRRPRISEMTVHLQNKVSAYTFEVHPDATKIQIKEAIKALTVSGSVCCGRWSVALSGTKTLHGTRTAIDSPMANGISGTAAPR